MAAPEFFVDVNIIISSSFDGVSGIRRVDPLDVEMRRRLLSAAAS
jgi:hypothetical protein